MMHQGVSVGTITGSHKYRYSGLGNGRFAVSAMVLVCYPDPE
jgi:hypothetical protein